jgi:NifU-like protein involved in Fe-S cluster formation
MNKSPYTEKLLKHYKNPVLFGDAGSMQFVVEHRNRSCGDRVLLGINVDAEAGRIVGIRHESDGCMLCKASASIMCQSLEGAKVSRAIELREFVSQMCDLDVPEDALDFEWVFHEANTLYDVDAELPETGYQETSAEKKLEDSTSDSAEGLTPGDRENLSNDLRALLEIRSFPTRKRCVTLPWEALDELLKEATSTTR